MGRPAFLSVLAIVALLVTGLGLWVAAPAFAAPKPIGLSDDGVTFGDHLPTSLFAGVLIVPGEPETRSFWVKNRQTTAGNLAIALQGVTGVDHALVSALSVHAVAGPAAGPVVAFPDADPCRSLLSAVALAPGAVVRIDVTLELSSSLPAHTSQGSLGTFDLPVTMTSADVAAPNGCAAVTPPAPGGGGGSSTPQAPPVWPADTVVVSGAAEGALPDEGGPDASGLPDSSGSGDGVGVAPAGPGTGRFPIEIVLWASLIAAILGGIFAAWRRRRRRDPEDDYA